MFLKKALIYVLALCLLLSFAVPAVAQDTENDENSLQDALEGIVAYYKNNKTNLETWREVIGLKKAGQIIADEESWTLPDWEIEKLDPVSSEPSAYAGIILGMLASGQDPANLVIDDQPARNLVTELAAMQNVDGSFSPWFNQTIMAVIALDEAEGNYDTEKAIAYLLSQKKNDGGFALFGETGDPDITGMVLVALALHADIEGVADAIAGARGCLKDLQLSNGGFASWGEENPESIAAVIRGLLACGEESIISGDWQKGEGNMIDALFAFQLEDGSFVHSADETNCNAMATEQALLAVAEMVNAGVDYTVKTGQKHTGAVDEKEEATIRVRVEGANANLADKTVTIMGGTAFDALQVAVGEENVTAPGGYITGILGESSGQISEDISTGWLYYVIREGAIESDAFSQGAGSFNARDGDEIIFYIGAMDSTWAPKTFFPVASIKPESPGVGRQISLTVQLLKNDWIEGLVELAPEEAGAIGACTVKIGEEEYLAQNGLVTFAATKAATLFFTITNQNELGFPNVVPYRGSISVGAAEDGGSGSSPDTPPPADTFGVAVVGRDGEKLFGPSSVSVTDTNRWGSTPLGALEATGLHYVISETFEGFVEAIAGQTSSGTEGWMYTVNNTAAMVAAKDYKLSSGDKVIWYYSKSIDQEPPTWEQLISGVSLGSTSPLPTSFITSTSGEAMLNPVAGGKVGLGSAVAVNIPANALSGTAGVNVAIQKVGHPPAAPAGLKLHGNVYEITAGGSAGYKFNQPVILTFSFAPGLLLQGVTPSVYYYDEESLKWVELDSTISGDIIEVNIAHLTKFAVFVKEAWLRPDPAKVFSDIQASFWGSEVINMLCSLGYINGYPDGTFKPDNWITRAEVVSILDKALNLSGSSNSVALAFSDVTPEDWFFTPVKNAVQAGIIKGYGNLFKPNNQISREELAMIMANALAKGDEAKAAMKEKTGFTDDSHISDWARGFVVIAAKADLLNGYPDNSLKPQGHTTRTEACAMVINLLNFKKPIP